MTKLGRPPKESKPEWTGLSLRKVVLDEVKRFQDSVPPPQFGNSLREFVENAIFEKLQREFKDLDVTIFGYNPLE